MAQLGAVTIDLESPKAPRVIEVPSFARADEYADAWAIEPNAGLALWRHAERLDLAAHMAQVQAQAQPRPESTIERIPAGDGKSVAVIRLQGLLMKQQSSLGMSTSTIQARKDIRAATADPSVQGILIAIESPGGTAAGSEALANDIRDAGKVKPVYAQIEDLGASAAYYAASQAHKIFASDRSTQTGSIGTMQVVHDTSAAAEQAGVKVHVFRTGHLKGAGWPGSAVTDGHQKDFQGRVDALQAPFDDAVQSGRRLSEAQLAAVKTGGVFAADEAIRLGLIDGIQSIDVTLAQLIGRSPGGKTSPTFQSAQAAAGGSGVSAMTFETYCTARGFDAATLNETQRAALLADFDAGQKAPPIAKPVPANGDGASHMGDIERFNANALRVAELQSVCQENGNPKVEFNGVTQTAYQHAVKGNLSVDDARRLCVLGNMRNERPVHAGVATGVAAADQELVIEAAILQSVGAPDLSSAYSDQILQTAHTQFHGRLSLQEMLIRAARANGYRSDAFRIHDGNLKTVLQYALAGDEPGGPMQANFSTFSLPGILSNVANKILLPAFMSVEGVYTTISSKTSVKDFKTIKSYRLTGDDSFAEVAPDGELEHATVGEETYSNFAKTYGKIWTVTRTDIINDDMGALDAKPRKIGRGARIKLNRVFWALFQSNPVGTDGFAFWSTQHANILTGAGSVLQSTSLASVLQKFRDLRDADGDPIDVEPKTVLVPSALEIPAWELVKSDLLIGITSVKQPNRNAWAGRFDLQMSKYLTSTTAWWLLGDPQDMPLIQICYLDGNESPTVQAVDLDEDVLGFGYRGFFDFGVAMQDYRGSVKSAGA